MNIDIKTLLMQSIVSKKRESMAYEILYQHHTSDFEELLKSTDNKMLPYDRLTMILEGEIFDLKDYISSYPNEKVSTLVYNTFDYPETLFSSRIHFPLIYGIGRMDILHTKCKRYQVSSVEKFEEQCRKALINNVTLVFHESDNLQPDMRKLMTECGVRWIEVVCSLQEQWVRQGECLVVSASPLSVSKVNISSILKELSNYLLSAITHG